MRYCPQEFGAVGDGKTDDTAAFQKMLAAIPTFEHDSFWTDRGKFHPGGGIVELKGIYLVSKTLMLPGGLTFEGCGWGASGIVFQPHVLNTSAVLFEGDPSRYSRNSSNQLWTSFQIKNCFLISDFLSKPFYSRSALNLVNFQRWSLDYVYFEGWDVAVVGGGSSYYNQISHCDFRDNRLHLDLQDGIAPVNIYGGVFRNTDNAWAQHPKKPNELIRVERVLTINGTALEPKGHVADEDDFVCVRGNKAAVHLEAIYTESPYPILESDLDNQLDQCFVGPVHMTRSALIRYRNFDLPVESPRSSAHISPPIRTSWDCGYMTDLLANPWLRNPRCWELDAESEFVDNDSFLTPQGFVRRRFSTTTAHQEIMEQTIPAADLEEFRGQRLWFGAICRIKAIDDFRFQVEPWSSNSDVKMARWATIDYGNDWKLYVLTYQYPHKIDETSGVRVWFEVTPENATTSRVDVSGVFCWINGIQQIPWKK